MLKPEEKVNIQIVLLLKEENKLEPSRSCPSAPTKSRLRTISAADIIFMARSLKKGPWVPPKLLKKIAKAKAAAVKEPIKTWYRAAMITPEMVGLTFAVHNGKNFINVFIIENMVGHRLGEFVLTRKFVKHGGRMQREQEAAAVEAEKREKAAAETKLEEKK